MYLVVFDGQILASLPLLHSRGNHLKLKNNYYFVVRFWVDFYDLSQLTGSVSVNMAISTRLLGRDITLSLG
jgi:hypothetical protein